MIKTSSFHFTRAAIEGDEVVLHLGAGVEIKIATTDRGLAIVDGESQRGFFLYFEGGIYSVDDFVRELRQATKVAEAVKTGAGDAGET